MDQEDSNVPVITLQRDRFCSLIGRELSVEQMARKLPWLGVDIEETGSDYVKIEFNPNRIDFSSYAGVAKAFQGLMGWKTGLPQYEVNKGEIALNVNPAVFDVRPYVLAATVRNLELNHDSIAELMEIQEDIHWGIGRDRKKVSIGVHNLENVKPPFVYTTADPDAVRFVPLGKTEEMSLREILDKHEKGIAYRHVVDGATRYPLILDSDNRVLSFPPIINGELTRVDEQTRNLFIEVTGSDQNAIMKGLNVLVTALADMGGTLESVQVKYQDRSVVSPDLTPQKMMLRTDHACKLLGLDLSEQRVRNCLMRCRLDAKRLDKGLLEVLIPAYRIDILHEVDLVEEAAIGYGYFRLKQTTPSTVATGEPHKSSRLANLVRQIMTGLGFTETLNFTLTNEDVHYEKMRKKPKRMIRLANPFSLEYSIIREDLLPGLIRNLADNKHESYPQQIFEVSDVMRIKEEAETRCERRLHVAAVSSYINANFTEVKSQVEALLANLGMADWKIKEARHPSFFEGRTAAIYVGQKKIGSLGEVHPQILNNFQLENPACAFEMDLEEVSC